MASLLEMVRAEFAQEPLHEDTIDYDLFVPAPEKLTLAMLQSPKRRKGSKRRQLRIQREKGRKQSFPERRQAFYEGQETRRERLEREWEKKNHFRYRGLISKETAARKGFGENLPEEYRFIGSAIFTNGRPMRTAREHIQLDLDSQDGPPTIGEILEAYRMNKLFDEDKEVEFSVDSVGFCHLVDEPEDEPDDSYDDYYDDDYRRSYDDFDSCDSGYQGCSCSRSSFRHGWDY